MIYIAVDIGNTSIRIGQYDDGSIETFPEPIRWLEVPTSTKVFHRIEDWLGSEPMSWFVSTVHRLAEVRLRQWIVSSRHSDRYTILTAANVPIAMSVQQPDRIGMDRLTAAVAANALRDSERPAIIIDAGSAITIDVVSAQGKFVGGAILPGIGMSAKALNLQTDQLPVVEHDSEIANLPQCSTGTSSQKFPGLIGKSTEQAIRSGLIWGTVGSLRYLVERFSHELVGSPQVFFAGGDAFHLAHLVHDAPLSRSDLVLLGVAITAKRLISNA